MSSTYKYFDDSFAELVRLEDGVPVQFCCLGGPYSRADEPALAERIFKLTGRRVRFAEWVTLQGDPREGGAEVNLILID